MYPQYPNYYGTGDAAPVDPGTNSFVGPPPGPTLADPSAYSALQPPNALVGPPTGPTLANPGAYSALPPGASPGWPGGAPLTVDPGLGHGLPTLFNPSDPSQPPYNAIPLGPPAPLMQYVQDCCARHEVKLQELAAVDWMILAELMSIWEHLGNPMDANRPFSGG